MCIRDSILSGRVLVDTTFTGTPTATEVVLVAGSTVDNFYNDQLLIVVSGTGAGQTRVITAYDGSTKTITLDESFATVPVASDRVIVQTDHVHSVSQIQEGLATSAEIAALNDFDPDNDVVANVALVDVTTTNTDMRGTDNAATLSDVKQAAIVGANS